MEFLLSDEAHERFHRIHEARGFRTKAETLEALIVAAELDSKIDPERTPEGGKPKRRGG